MSISSIANSASSWAGLLAQNTTSNAAASSTASAFAAAVDQMKGVAPVGASDSSSANSGSTQSGGSGDSGSEKTTTLTKVDADGSVLLIVMQGDTIISQRKISASPAEQESPKAMAVNAKLDQFNAGAGLAAGALFSADT